MARYLRIWRQCIVMALVRVMEYRVNFVVSIIEGVLQLALAVLSFLLLYRFTDQVHGWTQAQALLLVGIYRIVECIISLQIAPNMLAISGYIREGEMDFLLLRPVSSQFLASIRLFSPPEAVNALIGLLLVVYAGSTAGVNWSLGGIALSGAFMLCGLALLYALWFASVTLSFWLVQVNTLDTLFYGFFETARYPVSFFNGPVRALLTFVFPVAFATTFPTEALLGRADARLLVAGLALAVAALWATHLFWNYATRHYSSASS